MGEISVVKENRVLSISGGGIKGIAELVVLAKIEEVTGEPISKLFNIIAGTSVGGLIAALLTIPKEDGSKEPLFSAKQALEIFENSAEDIFPPKWHHTGGILDKLVHHKYSQKPLKKILKEYLGDSKFDDTETTARIMIPVFDVSGENDPNKIFDSSDPTSQLANKRDVVLATTAAPTYFKPVVNKDGKGAFGYDNGEPYAFVDGGLGANRPAAEALRTLKEGLSSSEQREVLDNTMVCSINFAIMDKEKAIPSNSFDGMIGWGTTGKIVNKLMKASEITSTKEVKRDLPGDGEFIEILLSLPKECSKLDNVSPDNIAKLKEAGKQYVANNKELLEKLCTTLVENVAREERSKLHESEISVEESSVSSESSKANDNIDKKGQDKDVNTHVISEEFEAKLAINLSEQQVGTLQEGLMKLTPKEYDVLQVFLKGLNDVQLVALSEHLPLIADGNFVNANISELSNFQNRFLKFFSSMFEHEDNIINDTILNCTQEYHEEVPCDGRGSESSHYVDAVY